VVDVGEEKSFVEGDVGGILAEGEFSGALVGVPPFQCAPHRPSSYSSTSYSPSYSSLLVVIPVPVTCIWIFSNIMTGLTTPVAHPLGIGFVVLPLPLLEDLSEALDDESHLLVVELGGIN
jgi:hypothetical protein